MTGYYSTAVGLRYDLAQANVWFWSLFIFSRSYTVISRSITARNHFVRNIKMQIPGHFTDRLNHK